MGLFSPSRGIFAVAISVLIVTSLPAFYNTGTSLPLFGSLIQSFVSPPPAIGTPAYLTEYVFVLLVVYVATMVFGILPGKPKKENEE